MKWGNGVAPQGYEDFMDTSVRYPCSLRRSKGGVCPSTAQVLLLKSRWLRRRFKVAALDALQTTVHRAAACAPRDSGGTGW